MAGMPGLLPLPTLLSSALVAFTVEFDNEFEHRMPHGTTNRRAPAPGAPWLTSQVMWANVMRHVDDRGTSLEQLHARARTDRDSLAGLLRWGYLQVVPPAAGTGAAASSPDRMVRPRPGGRLAKEVWEPLAGVIESRWRRRFGIDEVKALRRALGGVAAHIPFDLPDYLPVVYPTQNGKAEVPPVRGVSPAGARAAREPRGDLSMLLSHVLLGFTIDFERRSRISLPISANTLRVLDADGVRTRDLPALTGVSKEANAMCVGFLVRHGCAAVVPEPGASRGKVVRLTPKGVKAQDKYGRILVDTEAEWEQRFAGPIGAVRSSLERVVGDEPRPGRSRLFEGLEPYPDGWRAAVRAPQTLPHYPMVLHRGGYPDGS